MGHITNKCVSSWKMRSLIDHIPARHGVPSPVLGKDYAFDQNITPVYLDPVIIRRKSDI